MMIGIGIPSSHKRIPRPMVMPFQCCDSWVATAGEKKLARMSLFLADDLARGVLHMPDRAAHQTFGFFGPTFGLGVTVAGHLPDFFLDCAGRLAQTAFNPLLVHAHIPPDLT